MKVASYPRIIDRNKLNIWGHKNLASEQNIHSIIGNSFIKAD